MRAASSSQDLPGRQLDREARGNCAAIQSDSTSRVSFRFYLHIYGEKQQTQNIILIDVAFALTLYDAIRQSLTALNQSEERGDQKNETKKNYHLFIRLGKKSENSKDYEKKTKVTQSDQRLEKNHEFMEVPPPTVSQ